MIEKITKLGDQHFGKCTELVETEEGVFIRKPRNAKTESAFTLFCEKLEAIGIKTFARTAEILSVENDFHTEKVEQNNMTTIYGANLYYKRIGMLLFCSYILNSTDLHAENIIADGDMPVLVDVETLLKGKLRGDVNGYDLSKSVLCSHLLCNFAFDGEKTTDCSGISGSTADYKNIPHTQKGRVFSWEYRKAVLEGFEKVYIAVLNNKEYVKDALSVFDDCDFRQILRPSSTYQKLIELLEKVEPGKKESVAGSLLSVAFQRDVDKDRINTARGILNEEVRSITNGDIPLFHGKGNSVNLFSGDDMVMADFLCRSPVEYARDKVDNLSTEDMAFQKQIISQALDSSNNETGKDLHIGFNTQNLSSGEIIAEIITKAAMDPLPSVFAGLDGDSQGNVFMKSVGFGLYSGLSGVLCMYGALYRRTENTKYRDLLYKYYERLRKYVFSSEKEIILNKQNCGLADGIAGMSMAALHLGELVESNEFASDVKAFLGKLRVGEEPISADYLNGITALPLLELKVRGSLDPEILQCVGRAIENASPLTTGLAHGATGLALSSVALNCLTEDTVSSGKINSFLEYDENNYSKEQNNWYDRRKENVIGFMNGWCSGAPGAGMAYQRMNELTSDTKLQDICKVNIDRVKCYLAKPTPTHRDTLCCGTASRLMAMNRLGVENLDLYQQLVKREREGQLRVYHYARTNDLYPSLMQGLSGIAYALAMYGDSLCGGMLL